MNKIYKFAIFSEREKLFCIREFKEDKSQELRNAGYKIVNYTGDEIKAVDIENFESRGYKFAPAGEFLTIYQ